MTELEDMDNEFFDASKRIIANAKTWNKMKDNGAMSFTEGSEPIQLTEQERIKYVITQLENKLKRKDEEIANHIAVNSLLIDSDGEAYLANKLFKLTEELKQRDETIKQLTSDFRKVRYSFQQMNSRLMNDIIEYKEQIQQLRGALKWALNNLNNYDKPSDDEMDAYIKARKLID